MWDLIELLVYTCFLVLLTVSLSANPQSYPLFKTKALIENAMSAGAPCVCVCARARAPREFLRVPAKWGVVPPPQNYWVHWLHDVPAYWHGHAPQVHIRCRAYAQFSRFMNFCSTR